MARAAKRKALRINDVLSREILVEVLVRIPLRDAFRCQSVCKRWLSLIRDDPYFKRRFILERITGQASNEEDHQHLVYVQCSAAREMVPVVTPTRSIVNGRDLSLDFLPLVAREDPNNRHLRLVLGSCNGLLLCLYCPGDFSEVVYYICNPLTKQWLILPPSPNRNHLRVEVGFICDSFYHVQDDARGVTLNDGFGFKVVRLLFSLDGVCEKVMLTGVEIFTSNTGCWTTYTAECPIRKIIKSFPKIATPYNGRLYWMLKPSEMLVYDPMKDEFFVYSLVPNIPQGLAPFTGLSECEGSLWVGQVLGAQLKVYTVMADDCCLKHHVHNLDDLHFSPSSAKRTSDLYSGAVEFRTMHPSDPMIAYLSAEKAFLECDFGARTLKVVAETLEEIPPPLLYREWFNVFVISLPLWPTPLPTLPGA